MTTITVHFNIFQAWFGKNLTNCISSNDLECDFDFPYLVEFQLTYFCGSAPECRRRGHRGALSLAKYNAEKYYAVIGVTEHIRISLAILEKYIPR